MSRLSYLTFPRTLDLRDTRIPGRNVEVCMAILLWLCRLADGHHQTAHHAVTTREQPAPFRPCSIDFDHPLLAENDLILGHGRGTGIRLAPCAQIVDFFRCGDSARHDGL